LKSLNQTIEEFNHSDKVSDIYLLFDTSFYKSIKKKRF
jgi:hypothetical protein